MSLNDQLKNVLMGTKRDNASRRKVRSLLNKALGRAVRTAVDSLEGRRLLANPVADTGGPYTVNEGSSITIDAGGSTDDGSIDAYAWDLNYKVSKGFRRGVTGQAFTYEAGDSAAPRTIALKVTDNDGNTDITTTTLTVDDVEPTVTLVGPATVDEGTTYNLAWTSTDPGQDTITGYTIDWGDGNTTTHAANVNAATHVYDTDDTYTINFTATDEDGSHVTTKNVTVNNVAPVITAGLVSNVINEGDQARVNFASPNRAGTIDQWIIDWGDDSVSVRPNTKTFAQHVYADNGSYTVTVTALENDGTATDAMLALTVNNIAPTFTLGGIPDESPEGTAITATKTAVADVGVNDTFSYAWELKKGTSVVATSATTGNYTFTPTDNGAYTLKLTVTDNNGDSTVHSKAFAVTNVSPSGNVSATVPSPYYEGTTVQFTANPSDVGTDDTFTYDWRVEKNGNPWTLPGGLNHTSATFDFTPTDEGSYVVGVVITDDDGGQVIANSGTLTVVNKAPTAGVTGGTNANEGVSQSFAANAADAGAEDVLSYAWTVTKGGSPYALPGSVTTNASTLVFTPDDNGTYVASVTVTDADGGTVSSSSSSFTVANVAPTASLGVPGIGLTEGNVLNFTVTPADAGTADTFGYAWSVTKNGSPYDVSAETTNAATFHFTPDDQGSYVVSVAVVDDDGGSVTKTSSALIVANVAPTATISTPSGTIFEGDMVSLTSTHHDAGAGDSISYLWTVEKDGAPYTLAPGTVDNTSNFDFIVDDDGHYVVTLEVSDGTDSSTATRNLTVNNLLPSGSITGAPVGTVYEGDALALTVNPTDPGVHDTFTYRWIVLKGGVELTLDANLNNTSATFNYTLPDNGTYDIGCMITDNGGLPYLATMPTFTAQNVAPTGTMTVPTSWYSSASGTLATDTMGSVGNGFVGPDTTGGIVGEHATQGQRFVIIKYAIPNGTVAADVTGAALKLTRYGVAGTTHPVDLYTFDSNSATLASSDYTTIAAGGGTLVASDLFASGDVATIDNTAMTNAIKTAINNGRAYVSFAVRQTSLVNGGVLIATAIGGPAYSSPAARPSLSIRGPISTPGGVEGTALNFAAHPADVGAADTFSYSWSVSKDSAPFTLPGGTSTTGASFAFTPTDNGSYVVSVVISDDDSGAVTVNSTTFTITNVAPTATVSSVTTGYEGSALTFTANKADAGSADTHTYAWTVSKDGSPYTLSGGVSTTASTLVFTPDDEGSYVATVVVTDDDAGAVTAASSAVAVANVAPNATITGGPSVLVAENTSVTYGTSVTDAGVNDAKNYAWSVTRNNVAYDLTGVTTNAAGFTFTANDNGDYVLTVTVTDGDGGTKTVTKDLTVLNVNPLATVTTQPLGPVAQGSAASYVVAAQDQSPVDVLSYAWTITRGGVPYVLPNNVATDSSTFTFTPTLAGSYQITVNVTDNDGGSTGVIKNLTVTNVAPTISNFFGPIGELFKGHSLSFSRTVTDPGTETLTTSWLTTRNGVPFDTDIGDTYDFTPTLGGSYQVKVVVFDGTASDNYTAAPFTITNAAPSIDTMTRGGGSNEGQTVTYSASVSDADADDLTYLWTMKRGTTTIATATTPSFSAVAPQDGSYSMTLVMSDGETTSTTTQNFSIANVAPTAAIANVVGTPIEGLPVNLVGSGADVAADTLTYAWSITGNGSTVTATGATTSFTPGDNGTYVATLTVNDGTTSTTATKTITVGNNVPSGSLLMPTLAGVTTYEQSFSLEDVSHYIGDVVTIDWTWGNGEAALTNQPYDAPVAHHWNFPGTYNVTATIKDDDGSSTVVTQAFVVNDYGMQRDPMGGEGLALIVNGSDSNDVITFEKTPAGKIKAVRNGVSLGATFNPTRIIANGFAGVNNIVANSNVTIPVVFSGGTGKDNFVGGSGNDVLIGRKGIDVLSGGAGRDLLIGGADSDLLAGGAGEDIIIGGKYDSDDYTTLGAIMGEWTNNSRTFVQRTTRLRNGAEGLAALFASGTVIGDSRADQITAGTDTADWIFKDTFVAMDTIIDATSIDRVDLVGALT